jgi:hypothetical protein
VVDPVGVGSYETAWMWLHKLRATLAFSPGRPLRGLVEAYPASLTRVGGEEPWGWRSSDAFLAVELRSSNPRRIGQIRVRSEWGLEFPSFIAANVAAPSIVAVEDEFASAVRGAGNATRQLSVGPSIRDMIEVHYRQFIAPYKGSTDERNWPYYLAEFEFKFNHLRDKSPSIAFMSLVERSLQTSAARR